VPDTESSPYVHPVLDTGSRLLPPVSSGYRSPARARSGDDILSPVWTESGDDIANVLAKTSKEQGAGSKEQGARSKGE